ncbi:hypothetical protein MNB_SM-6-1112 [hydrothermal vent metagenome]|uniref:Uncharacterized protein n=1 Tax=hydrothermal vent metagenome TaxID=652676 RepID=A0A1W1BKB5_9ZZZZ
MLHYPAKLDIKSFDINRTIIILFAENKIITFQEAREFIIYIDLEHSRSKIDTNLAYKYIIKALSSLKSNYLDEVIICE